MLLKRQIFSERDTAPRFTLLRDHRLPAQLVCCTTQRDLPHAHLCKLLLPADNKQFMRHF